MHDETLTPSQRAALSALAPITSKDFYLAGGTGLCLRLAHRRSNDLDLFRNDSFDPVELLEFLRSEHLDVTNERSKPSTLWVEIEGVRSSFMQFPYPCIEPAESALGVPVATLADIAAMKVEAIASRGARKDFYDLYFICQNENGLGFALNAFTKRFQRAHPDLMHRLKAMTYFDDAEREPEPSLLKPVAWKTVRDYFTNEVRAYFDLL